MGLFLVGVLIIGFKANALTIDDAMVMIQNLQKQVLELKAQLSPTQVPVLNGNSGNYERPSGCTAISKFSNITGKACDGSQGSAYLPGCASNTGFSKTTGNACDGTKEIIYDGRGCSPVSIFSNITGSRCDGTQLMPPPQIISVEPVYDSKGCTITSIFSIKTGQACSN